MDKKVHLLCLFGRYQIREFEIPHLSGDLTAHLRRIKFLDSINPGLPLAALFPGFRDCISKRGNTSQSGHNNSF